MAGRMPAIRFPAVGRSCSRARRVPADAGVTDVDRTQNSGCCSLNPPERLGKRSSIAAVEVDVVARCVHDVETDCVSDHERDCFGFELARVTRTGTILAVMKKFVRLCSALRYVRSGRRGRSP
jgi:hypothetical protein